jgi:hypothetical protein
MEKRKEEKRAMKERQEIRRNENWNGNEKKREENR